MNVRDIIALPAPPPDSLRAPAEVSPETSLTEALAAMCSSGSADMRVRDDGASDTLPAWRMLAALGHLLHYEPEYSEITLRCPPAEYSASAIARAVEDADACLVSLLSFPAPEGLLEVWLRVNRADPSHCVRSLERYGFCVSQADGPRYADRELSHERITALQRYLNI